MKAEKFRLDSDTQISKEFAVYSAASGFIANPVIREKISSLEIDGSTMTFKKGKKKGVWFSVFGDIREKYGVYRYDHEKEIAYEENNKEAVKERIREISEKVKKRGEMERKMPAPTLDIGR